MLQETLSQRSRGSEQLREVREKVQTKESVAGTESAPMLLAMLIIAASVIRYVRVVFIVGLDFVGMLDFIHHFKSTLDLTKLLGYWIWSRLISLDKLEI